MDLNKLADDGLAALGKLNDVATKAEGFTASGQHVVDTAGPEIIKILEEFKTVMTEAGPVLATIMPFVKMLAAFFPHANPVPPAPTPAGAQ
jgi:hypothetical protein